MMGARFERISTSESLNAPCSISVTFCETETNNTDETLGFRQENLRFPLFFSIYNISPCKRDIASWTRDELILKEERFLSALMQQWKSL